MEQHVDDRPIEEKIEGVASSWAEDVEQHMGESTWYGELLDGLLEEQDPTLHRDDMRELGMLLVVEELAKSYNREAYAEWKQEHEQERKDAREQLIAGVREFMGAPDKYIEDPLFWLDLLKDAGIPVPPSTWTAGPLQWMDTEELRELDGWVRSL
jgi:hypothetical protein